MVQEKIATYGAKPKTYTLREYLAREERVLHKHEFHNGQIIKMPGSSINHNVIATNILIQFGILLQDAPEHFTIINSDQKIYIAAVDKVLYPDVLVVFEAPERWENRDDLLVNPLLIVEVWSKSTGLYDRNDKFMYYRMLPSFKEYVLIQQDTPKVEAFYKTSETTWDIMTETNLENTILLRSLGIAVSLQKIYKGIVF
jgi:Uma2 family endonuclease